MRVLSKTSPVLSTLLAFCLLASLIGNLMLYLQWQHARTALGVAEAMLAEQEYPEPNQVSDICVHVVGEVKQPGIYTLENGSRVYEAIEAAGGLTPEADVKQINLAALAIDGKQIIVPKEGEDLTSMQETHSGKTTAGLININTASIELLETLPGIGPAKASAIVQYRQQHGAFQRLEDLLNVKGIGPATFESIKNLVTVR